MLWLKMPSEDGGVSKTQIGTNTESGDFDHDLASRLAEVDNRLATVESAYRDMKQRTQADNRPVSPAPVVQHPPDTEPQSTNTQTRSIKRRPGLKNALLQAGIPADTAEQIMQQVGKNRMAILALRDKAAREGKLGTTTYMTNLNAKADASKSLRNTFGDDIYDSYLYATGMTNRVMVTDVYPDSAAGGIGIQSGDIVLRYGSKHILTMNDLKAETVSGIRGEAVLVVWLHDGIEMNATVPRGPLGIGMEAVTSAPGQP